MNYTSEIPSYGEVMTRKEYIENVKLGSFIDYDGNGYPMRDGKMDRSFKVFPSELSKLPKDCTHVIWFNK